MLSDVIQKPLFMILIKRIAEMNRARKIMKIPYKTFLNRPFNGYLSRHLNIYAEKRLYLIKCKRYLLCTALKTKMETK